ncbi:hypothetical protein [Cupriavidus sp. BIS7]|uniref:hypothetical protein n=1 Tax=Cupriavidus sp. BIS7 TaxID=1217718 RepID=UPI001ED974B9|nr:hypothetical protein [Cupriavidus sp. BIS7]
MANSAARKIRKSATAWSLLENSCHWWEISQADSNSMTRQAPAETFRKRWLTESCGFAASSLSDRPVIAHISLENRTCNAWDLATGKQKLSVCHAELEVISLFRAPIQSDIG